MATHTCTHTRAFTCMQGEAKQNHNSTGPPRTCCHRRVAASISGVSPRCEQLQDVRLRGAKTIDPCVCVCVLQTDKQPPRKHLGGTPEMLPLKLQVTTPLRLQGLSGIGFTQSLQRPVRPDCPVRCHKCSWPAIVTVLAAPSPPPCHLKDSRNRGTDLGWRAHSETPVPRRPDRPTHCHKSVWPAIVTVLAAPSLPPCHLNDSGNRAANWG